MSDAKASAPEEALLMLETWTQEGQRRRAPVVLGLELVPSERHGDPQGGPRIRVVGLLVDDGLPMTWTLRTRTQTDHEKRTVSVVLDVVAEPLPTSERWEPSERPLSLTVHADPRPDAKFSDQPYEVTVLDSDLRRLARRSLTLRPAKEHIAAAG